MLANVYTKSVRDRALVVLGGAFAVAVMLLGGMAVYADIDVSFYYELPASMLEAMGVSPDLGGVGGIAYGAIYNLLGAMTIAGLAISIGASSIAGEERDGTIGLLLGNPTSRASVLAAKLGSLVTLVTVGGVVLWAGGLVVPAILDVDVTGVAIGALAIHLAVNALFWGLLAAAIGGWTGSRTAAGAGAAGVMVLSWLATSLLPFIDGGDTAAQLFPWYYFSGSQPELNGIDWAHLGVLGGLSVAAAAVAFVGVRRRDLRQASSRTTVLDRLREHPRTQALADRVGGSARTSSITARTLSDNQAMVVGAATVMLYMGLLFGPMYNLLPEEFTEVMGDLPEALLAMIGGVDMSTPTGWLQGELFSLVLPIVFIGVLALVGSRALAGEEEDHTMGLLLSSPVSRTHVVLSKAGAMVIHGLVLGGLTLLGTAAGVVLGGLDVSILNLLAITTLGTLLGLVFGALALAISAATGRTSLAVAVTAVVGLFSYFVDAFFPLAESFEGWAAWSPFHYFLGSDPLTNGMAWGDAGVLAALTVVLTGVAVPLFERRDLRG